MIKNHLNSLGKTIILVIFFDILIKGFHFNFSNTDYFLLSFAVYAGSMLMSYE